MEKKENWILGDWRQAVLTQTATIHDAVQVLNEVALKIVRLVDEVRVLDGRFSERFGKTEKMSILESAEIL